MFLRTLVVARRGSRPLDATLRSDAIWRLGILLGTPVANAAMIAALYVVAARRAGVIALPLLLAVVAVGGGAYWATLVIIDKVLGADVPSEADVLPYDRLRERVKGIAWLLASASTWVGLGWVANDLGITVVR